MKKSIVLIIIISLIFVSCKDNSHEEYVYRTPENINDGFAVGSLDEVNIDSSLIKMGVDSINTGKYKEVHSMLVYKDGKLVLEEYFKGHKFKYDTVKHLGELVMWNRTMPHRIMSDTKSITSICIGIAVDKGFIKSVHQSIFDYLPEHQHLNKDGKDKITIEHLLTMTSGLAWNEWAIPYGSGENDVIKMHFAGDQVEFVLSKPLTGEPGKGFNYAGGNNILLGEILKTASKMKLDDFSEKYLFEPLGVDNYFWLQYDSGVVDAAGSLHLTPRAMTKIGVTFLNKGIWSGKQIISEQWVDKSAASFAGNSWLNNWDDHFGMRGYSYSWWTHQFVKSGKRIDMYYAGGWGGQYIMVIPDLNTVVVFTGGNYLSYRPPFEILKKYIVPAIK